MGEQEGFGQTNVADAFVHRHRLRTLKRRGMIARRKRKIAKEVVACLKGFSSKKWIKDRRSDQ